MKIITLLIFIAVGILSGLQISFMYSEPIGLLYGLIVFVSLVIMNELFDIWEKVDLLLKHHKIKVKK